jgi:AbrB family looped-hinge helix DNA binding protein
MNSLDMTRLSSKGQVVIPGDVRASMGLSVGTKFVVMGDKDTIVLKRVGRPSLAEARHIFKEGQKYARRVGLKKSDVEGIIHQVRRGQ